MRMKPPNQKSLVFIGILYLFIIGINADGCRRGCPRSDSGKLKYSPGIAYNYKFDSVVSIGIQNAQNEEAGMKLKGNAILYFEGDCSYTLKLDHVEVQTTLDKIHKDMNNDFNKPIQFTMVNGELESQICSEQNDNEFSLNIKRGIVSMFQTSENKYETDVFGVCPTETSISRLNDGTQIITKLRNLNSCNYRENINAFYVTGIVNEKSGIKSRPILNGEYIIEQKLLNDIYHEIELTETYNSPQQIKTKSVLSVKVKTILKLEQQNGDACPELSNKKSKSIIFSHPNHKAVQNFDVLRKVFDETVNLVTEYVKADSAQHFSELIRLMRNADFNTLIELSSVRSETARKVYFDALIRTGTPESVKAIVKQISKWNDKEKKIALMSLVLVHSIDLDSLNSVANLLTPNAEREAYLSIGTLVNKYCTDYSCDNGEVDSITQKFSNALRNCQANTKKDENHIVSVLKGIRNVQHIANSITSQLLQCTNGKHSSRIRVAALQAYSASSCNKLLQENAMNLLRDRNEDSEIRIEAYLAAINCPNGEIANEIAELINSETINQVGGFLTSHIRSIRDSTDFTKQSLKHHLGNIRITKKFPIDPRRFSFNSDASYSIDSLGIGAGLDYSVIYSQKGFLPRSLRLNVTNEAFGTSFNMFDISMRQENLEHVLEHFFGPKGFFSQEPQIIFDQVKNYLPNEHSNGGRSKRNIQDDTNNMALQYKTYGNNDNKFVNDINLDLSMKMFGSELAFLSFGDHIPSNADELSNILTKIISNLKNNLKKYEKTFDYHSLLQDVELVYPTGAGLPLECAVKSSLTSKLNFGIEFDLDNINENSKSRLKFIPSQDYNLETFLRIDAGVLSTGLRTSTNLHSADGADIKIELINDKKGFNIDLQLPRENVELIEFKHNIDFFISEQDKEIKILPFKQNKKRKTYQPVCFDQLQMFGLTVCYTANLPSDNDLINDNGNKLPFLYNGPMQMSLSLHTEKHIQVKGLYNDNNEYQSWQLMYDTPGSRDSHKTELQLKLGVKPKLFARIDFINPQKHLAGEGGIINNDKEFVLYGQFEVDNDKNLQKIGFSKNGKEYRPLIQMIHGNHISNDIAGYKADGRVIEEQNGKYKFDNFRIITPENKETIINGWIEYYGHLEGFDSDLNIRKSNQNYKINAHFKHQPSSIDVGGFITDNNNPDSKTGGSFAIEYTKEKLKQQMVLQTGVYHLQLFNNIENTGEITSDDGTLTFSNGLQIKNTKERSPLLAAKLNGQVTKKLVQCDFEATRLDKTATLNVKIGRNQRADGDFDLYIKAKLNRHFVDLKTKIDVQQGKYIIDSILITSTGTQFKINGDINQHLTSQNAIINLDGNFKLHNNDKENIFKLKFNDIQEKVNGEFKLKRDNTELISCNLDLQRNPDKHNFNFKLIIKDNLTLNSKFNLNKNGRGDYSGQLHIKKLGKPIKINGKFLYALPKLNFDTTITMDDKKITYKTENELLKAKFNTKNYIEIGTEKLQFDASSKTTNDGETNTEFLLLLPTERKLNGKFNRHFNIKSKNNDIKLELYDTQPDGKIRSINFESVIKDLERSKRYYNIESKFIYNNFDQKNLMFILNTKHLPKGEHQTAELNIELSGTILNEKNKLNINFVEFSKEHAIYRVTSNYGQKFVTNINGNHYLKNIENDKLIGNYEIQINVNAPETNFKRLSLTSNGKILNNYNIIDDDDKLLHNIEFNLNYKISDKDGNANIQLKNYNYKYGQYELKHNCHTYGNNNLIGTWKRDLKKDLNGKINSGKIEYSISYETDKNGNGNIKMQTDFLDNEYINLHYTIKTTYEKLQDLDILLKLHHSDDHTYTKLLKIKNEDKEYTMTTNVYTGLLKMGIDLNLQTPTEQSKLLTIFEKLQEHHIKGEILIKNILNIDFIENIELQFKSPEDFYLIGNINSNKFKLDNINIDIRGQKKIIKFNIESSNTKLLNGNIQYNIKNEKNKIILEGRGDLLTQNERQSASFTFIRQLFDLNQNDEFGFEYTFNGELGRKNYVSTLKITNKNFIIKLTGCEESKQCTNFEIQSVITMKPNDYTNIIHELMILIDLREFGYPYEFELQSKSSKLNLNVKHEIDATITSNNNKKYKLLVNIKPENNLIQLQLPKRTIVFETHNIIPENGGLFGKYENSIEFYFDKKNKPNDKAALTLLADLSGIKNNIINSNFEIKYENPYLQKPLLIKGEAKADRINKIAQANIIFNIFKLDEQKIIGEVKASGQIQDKQFIYNAESKFYSTGLGFNYKAKALAKLNYDDNEIHLESLAEGGGDMKFLSKLYGKKDTFDIQLIGFNQQLFNMKGIIDTNKHLIKTDSTYQIIGSKPIKFITEFSPTKLKAILKRDGLLTATSELIVGKEGRIQLIKNTDNKQIYNAKLSLDPATFLKTTYEVNKEELNDFMKLAEEELVRDTDLAKAKLNEKYEKATGIIEDRIQKAKDSLPDLSKLIKNYQNNFKSIVNELEEDPALKKLFTEFRHIYEKIFALLQDFIQKSTEFYQKLEIAFQEFYEKQQQLFYNTILPALKDLNSKLTEILNEFYSELIKIARQVFDRAHKAWKNFENDFKEISKPIQELLKPIGDVINDLIKILTKEFTEFSIDIKEYIDKLPDLFKELSEKLNEQLIKLRNIDELLIILRDIFQQLETYTVSSEGKEFLSKLYNYIEAKLLNKSINDAEELEGLYYSLIQCINSFIIQLTGDHKHDAGTPGAYYNLFMQPLSISLDALSKIPVWFSFKFSSLNYLRNERFESLTDLLVFILPSTLDFAPPYQLNGHIADGQHIFTFDGRYITFPGSCRYILAQDSVDNNFTVVANLANGKMQSIILIDKKNYVEVNNNGILKLNDKKTEYPIHENGIHAWRRYYTVSLLSTYGVLVKCSIDLRVCHVSVNGFYTAKMRGLFGNGNSEPYDDFMTQTGEILENSNDFCNTYGLTKCPPVQAQQVDINKNEPVCNELFDVDSTLLFGYLFIDRKPYREACNAAIQLNSNLNDAACNIALTYASAARLNNNLPVSLPNVCAKCTDSGKKLNIGDEFSTKIPNNKADVIVVVDTELGDELLNEMVQPLFNNLRQQLKARNLNDVHIAVIAFNDNQKYSNILTTNGKLNFNGKLTDMTLTGPKYDDYTEYVGINKLNELLEKLKEIQTPLSSDYKAVKLALSYPFRSDAAKSILFIREDNNKIGIMDTLASSVLNFIFKNKGLSFNYLGPIKGLIIDGKPAEKIVGFSKRAIAFQNGLSNRNKKLEYDHAAIIDRLVEDDNVVFSLDNFKQLKSPEQKNAFVTQVSTMLADQLYKTEIGSTCLCSLKYGLHGESTCQKQSYEYVQAKKMGGQKQG